MMDSAGSMTEVLPMQAEEHQGKQVDWRCWPGQPGFQGSQASCMAKGCKATSQCEPHCFADLAPLALLFSTSNLVVQHREVKHLRPLRRYS